MLSVHPKTASAAANCGWQEVGGKQDVGNYYLILWDYTCDGGYHTQLIAKNAGCYDALLWGDYSTLLDDNPGGGQWLNPGGYINTNTWHGYSNYEAGGDKVPSC